MEHPLPRGQEIANALDSVTDSGSARALGIGYILILNRYRVEILKCYSFILEHYKTHLIKSIDHYASPCSVLISGGYFLVYRYTTGSFVFLSILHLVYNQYIETYLFQLFKWHVWKDVQSWRYLIRRTNWLLYFYMMRS